MWGGWQRESKGIALENMDLLFGIPGQGSSARSVVVQAAEEGTGKQKGGEGKENEREDDEENNVGDRAAGVVPDACPEPSCTRSRNLPNNNIHELPVGG